MRRSECVITSTWFSGGEGDRCNKWKIDAVILVLLAGRTSFCCHIFQYSYRGSTDAKDLLQPYVRYLQGYTCCMDMKGCGASIDIDVWWKN